MSHLTWLAEYDTALNHQEPGLFHRGDWLQSASWEELTLLFQELGDRPLPEPQSSATGMLRLAALGVTHRVRGEFAAPNRSPVPGDLLHFVLSLAQQEELDETARDALLSVIALGGESLSLAELVEELIRRPPVASSAVATVLAPLFLRQDFPVNVLFPRLLNALAHRSLAAAVLDLGNYLFRQQRCEQHPAASWSDRLVALLGEITQRLTLLEESPDKATADVIGDSLALAVSLCDSLALLQVKAAIGKLNQLLEVGHRRLRAEAAVALAALGEENAKNNLANLAAEPLVRLRILSAAAELGLEEAIDSAYSTDTARAEAELVMWLALPLQFGVAPARVELFDQCTQFWPGYEDPVDCYLFQFEYTTPEGPWRNVGLVGPATCAFTADLTDLPPADIYAAYAGWQAEHEDVYEIEATMLSPEQRVEVSRLERKLHDCGYYEITPVVLGSFFGDKVLVCQALFQGQPGAAIADSLETYWFPARATARPVGPNEAYFIYKGRKLLRAFNPEE